MKVRRITPALFIRQHLLGMTTREFAESLGVSQGAVSRYDETGTIPDHHHKKVRNLAVQRKTVIKAGWFKKVPFAADVPV